MHPPKPVPGGSPGRRQAIRGYRHPPKDGRGIYWAFAIIATAIAILALAGSA